MSFSRLRLVLPAAILAVSAVGTTAPLAAHADTLCNGGGQIVVGYGASLSLSNCSVSGNSLTGFNDGAGIQNHGMLTLDHVTITNNHTDASGNGGGINNDGAITGTSVTVSNNSAGSGGGIRNYGGGSITLTSSTISGNSAKYGGGILNLQNVATSTLTLHSSAVMGNSATNDGGGIYNSAVGTVGATLIADHTSISGNTSSVDGGGIADTKGTVTLTDVTINDNTAQLDGGGMAESGSLVGTNLTLSHNSAAVKGGGIATDTGGNTSLINATISDNSAPGGGGGAYEGNVPGPGLPGTTLQDTLLARNSPANCLGGFTSAGHNLDTGASCAFAQAGDQSNVGDAAVGLGTLANNTGAVMTEALSPASPAVNAGGAACALTDARDVARPQGTACDIGSFELEGSKRDVTPPSTTASFSGTTLGTNYTGTVTATLNAVDNAGGTGVATTYYAVDNASCAPAALTSCTQYTTPFSITGVGPHTVYFFSVDRARNVEAVEQQTLQIVPPDTTPPTTTGSLAGTSAGGSSYSGPVTVTLSAADNAGGSGVATTYYTVDNAACTSTSPGSCQTYSTPFSVSSAQAHTVYFFSVDKAGNAETVKQIAFTIVNPDTTPPTTTASLAGTSAGGSNYTGPVTVTLSASDNTGGSGVATTYYAVDSAACTNTSPGSCQTYSTPFSVSSAQAHTIYFFSVDKAGNAETVKKSTFTIVAPDTTPPTTTASLAGTSAGSGSYSSPVTVTLSATDNAGGSGVATTYYAIDSASCTPVVPSSCQTYGTPFTVSGVQSHTVYFFSVDKAGNPESVKQVAFSIVTLDTTAPTTTASLAGTSAGSGSYSSPVTVTLSATDNAGGSGVAATYYAVDSASCASSAVGSCQTYSAPFSVSSVQAHTVYFFSVDKAGNAESVKQVGFTIVNAAPQPVTITGDYQCSSGPLPAKSTIKGALVVGAGISCTLTGVTIGSGVKIASGGTLIGHTLAISGDVQGDGAKSIVLDGASVIHGKFKANGTGGVSLNVAGIDGEVQINNTMGTVPGGINTICSSAIHSLQINNSAANAPWDVGGAKDCASGNIIAQDAELNNNKGAITVSNNRIGGSLKTKKDTGGLTVSNNHVGGGGGDNGGGDNGGGDKGH